MPRVRVLYSAAWGSTPWRVFVGETAVLLSDNRQAARAFADRLRTCQPVSVLRGV